jgi:hypothetical protein
MWREAGAGGVAVRRFGGRPTRAKRIRARPETCWDEVVRLRPALAAPAGWVFELVALVERWLDACNLQVASVHHGSRSYVITAAPHGSQSDGGPEPAVAV